MGVTAAQISHIRWECLITSSLHNIMLTPTNTSSLSFILVVLTVSLSLTSADVNTMTDKILKDIMKDYNPDSRPAGKLSDRKSFAKPQLSEEIS